MLTMTNTRTRWRNAGCGRAAWWPSLVAAAGVFLAGCTPPGPRALLDGERLLLQGKPEEALRRLRTAVEFLPGNAQAWNHLGLAFHATRQPSEAVDAYQRALQVDRNLAVAHYNLGCLFQEQGDAARAADAFGTFVQLQPRALEGWVRLGQVQLKARRWEQAERSFQSALRQLPGDPDALNGLGVALQQRRRVADAWGCFTNVVTRHPGFAPAWLNLAVAAQQSGLKSFAAQAYRHYASLSPESARTLGVVAVAEQLEAVARPTYQLPPPPATNALAGARPTPGPGVATNPPTARTNLLASTAARTSAPPVTLEATRTMVPPAQPATNLAGLEPRRVANDPTPPAPAQPVQPAPRAAEPLAGAGTSPQPVVTLVVPPPARPTESTNIVALASLPATRPQAAPAPLPAPVPPPAISVPVPPVTPSPTLALARTNTPGVTATNTVPPGTAPPIPLLASLRTGPETDRVPPPLQVTPEVHDEPPPPAPRVVSGATPEPTASSSTNRPLVRPVSRQRPAGSLDEKTGFWTRANPAHWFGDEEGRPEGLAEVPEGENQGEGGAGEEASGRWRWANPTKWFRGERGPEEGRPPTPVGVGWSSRADERTGTTGAGAGGLAPTNRVAFESTSAPRRVAMAAVERTPAPAPVPVPVPVVTEPVREVRRYGYRNPTTPRTGEVAAAQEQVALGVMEHRRDRLEAAVRHYETARDLDPSSFEAWHNLALARLQRGEVTDALAASELALAVQPDSAAARFTFALALDRAGYPLDAAAEAERVVRRRSDDAAGHLLLGNLYSQRLGDPGKARTHYLRVIELQPDHPQSIAIRNWLADHR